jgi:hypothetical protein
LKSKTKTYLLLAAVLGIWGTIGYRIISVASPTFSEVKQDNFDMVFNPKSNTEADTFSIQSFERDPFLGTLSHTKKAKNLNGKEKPLEPIIDFMPSITYSGLVKKQSTTNQVFVVTINNNQFLLKKGQIADSVTLVKGSDKEIVIRYHKKNQTIKRQ